MSDTAEIIDACLEQSEQLDPQLSWMQPDRLKSRQRLKQNGLPAARSEHWKYARLENFIPDIQAQSPASDTVTSPVTSNAASGKPLQCDDVIQALKDPQSKLPRGLSICLFSKADEYCRSILNSYFNHLVSRLDQSVYGFMSNLNTCLLGDGLLIHVAENTHISKLLDLSRTHSPYQRMLIVLEQGASLNILEQPETPNIQSARSSHIVECLIKSGSRLKHTRIQHGSSSSDYALTAASVEEGASYKLELFALGTPNRRHDVNIKQTGDRSEVELVAALHASESERLELKVNMEHIGLHTHSEQLIRSIARDRARVSINGRIHIHKGAQQSDATLTNKNLLLDNRAQINTKPELEIYADQVKCAHGATVGQISEEEIFYLQSRGIDLQSARQMLSRGFLKACFSKSSYQEYVTQMFEEALAK